MAEYFLPPGYAANPAVSFDKAADDEGYWDAERMDASLAYQAAVYDWALELIRSRDLRSVADFGCGNAAKLALLHAAVPTLETWGLDQPNAIKACESHHNFGHWFAVNLDQPLELPNRHFDLIVASDVIEHLEDPDRLISAITQVAHEKTLVLLSTPERIRLRGRRCNRPPNPYHVREWSQAEFARYLRSHHFNILEHRMLPAYRIAGSPRFFRRAVGRWMRLKSISYNQAVLASPAR